MLSLMHFPLISFPERSHTECKLWVELPSLRHLEKKASERVHLGQLIIYPNISSQKLQWWKQFFVSAIAFISCIKWTAYCSNMSAEIKRGALSPPGNAPGSEETAQVLLAMPSHSLGAACPVRKQRDVLSKTTGMLRAPPLQQPREDWGEGEGNI